MDRPINLSEEINHFIDNFAKILFQNSADIHPDSRDIEKKLGNIPLGAGKIAGPIAFSAMSTILQKGEDVSMGELTKKLRLPPATTNRLVTWFVDNGIAERLQDPRDKRVIRVRITDTGRKFQEISREIAIARLERFFSKLNPEENTIFNLLHDKLMSDKGLDRRVISLSERIGRFIDNYKTLLYQIAVDRHVDSAEAEKKLGDIPHGAGKIAGPIAFSLLSTILKEGQAVTMGELTRKLRLPHATTNHLVSWFVDNGMAERLRNPYDQRVIRVKITGAGRVFQEIAREIAVARMEPFFRKLTPEETTIFNLLFDKLVSDIKHSFGELITQDIAC